MFIADDGGGGGILKSLKKASADGHFAINETGGQALLEAFREMADWVDRNRHKLENIAEQPSLGSSNGANTMKPFVQNVATDEQGFITMLLRFRDSLADGEAGVQAAMNNYQQLDQSTANAFRQR